ncbi:MAG: hypothetical protein AB7U23_10075 [Dehalococcoidia bacterium]
MEPDGEQTPARAAEARSPGERLAAPRAGVCEACGGALYAARDILPDGTHHLEAKCLACGRVTR